MSRDSPPRSRRPRSPPPCSAAGRRSRRPCPTSRSRPCAASLVKQAQGIEVVADDRPVPSTPADHYASSLVQHLEASEAPADGGVLEINGSPTDAASVLCSTFAAMGGVPSAARLASASQQAGTGDVNLDAIAAAVIGGTSLFGGCGSALRGPARHRGDPVHRQRADAARSVVVAPLHDHGWGPRHRGHRRLAGLPVSRVSHGRA